MATDREQDLKHLKDNASSLKAAIERFEQNLARAKAVEVPLARIDRLDAGLRKSEAALEALKSRCLRNSDAINALVAKAGGELSSTTPEKTVDTEQFYSAPPQVYSAPPQVYSAPPQVYSVPPSAPETTKATPRTQALMSIEADLGRSKAEAEALQASCRQTQDDARDALLGGIEASLGRSKEYAESLQASCRQNLEELRLLAGGEQASCAAPAQVYGAPPQVYSAPPQVYSAPPSVPETTKATPRTQALTNIEADLGRSKADAEALQASCQQNTNDVRGQIFTGIEADLQRSKAEAQVLEASCRQNTNDLRGMLAGAEEAPTTPATTLLS